MEIERKYNARTNVLKMFKDRGYFQLKKDVKETGLIVPNKGDLIDIENNMSFEEFQILKEKNKDTDIYNIWNPFTKRFVYVIYSNDDKGLASTLYKTLSSIYSVKEDIVEKSLHIVIIATDESYFKKLDSANIEVFNLNKLAISYISHRYQPIEIKLYRKTINTKEYADIIEKFEAKTLKIIAKLDPITKYYNASIDDIFLFNSIEFRIVKNVIVKT